MSVHCQGEPVFKMGTMSMSATPMTHRPNFILQIGRIGIQPHFPPDKFRCLFATNLACLFHLASTLPYVFLFAVYQAWMLSSLALGLCMAYPLSLLLMKRQQYTLARFTMLGSITSAIFAFSILLGEASRLETTLLYTVAAPAIFFSVREIKWIGLAVLWPVIAYTLLHLGAYHWASPFPLTIPQLELFNVLITATTALLILLPIVLLLKTQVDTEQALIRAKDKAESSSRAKGEFLATVSHELRTPLNGLLGTLELMESENLTKDQKENLSVARTSGHLLRTVIADILDFSRFEKGLISLESKPIHLPDLLRNTLAGFKRQIEEKRLQLQFAIHGEFPTVLGDSSRIQQIITNLVGNALKFTDEGKIVVRIFARPSIEGSLPLTLEVEDTGIGIPENKLENLFDPFTQAHRNLRPDTGGCGLGLSICNRLATLMGGHISVSTQVGQGSLFTVQIHLPVQDSIANPSLEPKVVSLNDCSQKPRSGKVLLVEDIAINRMVATKFLNRMGLDVDAACDGKQGVDAYLKGSYDWILMDCQMPVMDGYEATREIKRLARNGLGPPSPIVIALTANAQPDDQDKCLQAGMDAFLEKPLSMEALQKVLSLDTPTSEPTIQSR
jgi:signal transduction histidine kinase/CheY-like chemotaxis protein